MKIIDRIGLSEQKKALVRRIHQYMDIDMEGLYIVFDDYDYTGYINRRYANLAFHMNVEIGGVEEMSPTHILEIMENSDCKHFIWISRTVPLTDDMEFSWIYSHELQHMAQDIKYPNVSSLTCFLLETYRRVDPATMEIDIPAELDSELKAVEIISAFFGADARREYLRNRLPNMRTSAYARRLESLIGNVPIDIEKGTINILCRHKVQFIEQLKLCNTPIKRFNIDLDTLCKEHGI